DPATPPIYTLSLHDALPISMRRVLYGASGNNPVVPDMMVRAGQGFFEEIDVLDGLPDWITGADLDYYTSEFERTGFAGGLNWYRSEEHTSELQSRENLVCRL